MSGFFLIWFNIGNISCSFAGVEWKKTQIGHMSLCPSDWQNHSSSPIHTPTIFVNGNKEDKSEEWEERLWENKIAKKGAVLWKDWVLQMHMKPGGWAK